MKVADLPPATITFEEAQRRYHEMHPLDKAVVIATPFEDDEYAATEEGMIRIIEHHREVLRLSGQEQKRAPGNRHTRRAEAVRRRGAKAGGGSLRP